MRWFLAAGAALLLAGCVTEQPANQAQIQKLGETCQAYGFKPGTDEFAACIFQLDQQRIAGNRQNRLAVAAALQRTGAAMQAANRPVTCRSVRYGNTVTTQCN